MDKKKKIKEGTKRLSEQFGLKLFSSEWPYGLLFHSEVEERRKERTKAKRQNNLRQKHVSYLQKNGGKETNESPRIYRRFQAVQSEHEEKRKKNQSIKPVPRKSGKTLKAIVYSTDVVLSGVPFVQPQNVSQQQCPKYSVFSAP